MDPEEQLSSLSWHEAELANLASLLRVSSSSTILSGPAGVGKTTLVNEAIGLIQQSDPDAMVLRAAGRNQESREIAQELIESIFSLSGKDEGGVEPREDLMIQLAEAMDHFSRIRRNLYVVIDDMDSINNWIGLVTLFSMRSKYLHFLGVVRSLDISSKIPLQMLPPHTNVVDLGMREYEHVASRLRKSGELLDECTRVSQTPISVFINPGSASSLEVEEFFAALANLHRACGGFGITIRDGGSGIFQSHSSCK